MNGLKPAERDHAARVLRYLVTPSGTKIALSVGDLADFTGLSKDEIRPVLAKLASGDARILRQVAAGLPELDEPRYEIYHDALAAAILDWRARQDRARERTTAEAAGRTRTLAPIQITIGGWLVLLSLMMVGLTALSVSSSYSWIYAVTAAIFAAIAVTLGRVAAPSVSMTTGIRSGRNVALFSAGAWLLGLTSGVASMAAVVAVLSSLPASVELVGGRSLSLPFGDTAVRGFVATIGLFVVQCFIVGLVVNSYARGSVARSDVPSDLT
jgi:hypothetical protein